MTPPPPQSPAPRPASHRSPRWLGQLLHWFAAHRRPMPWRDDPTPYKVWISEIMLQQTRVTAVIPFFERFIQRFPDVHALAQAPLEHVLKTWEGLGYYSRARHLHAAAQHISQPQRGGFPATEAAWRSLPGVGPYTAAAIASIALGQPAAAIDGNVMRVWTRLRGIRENVGSEQWRTKARRDLLRYARQCDPALFNQAMMELGALVCLPRNPCCQDCPLHQACIARRKQWTDVIPARKPARHLPHRDELVLLIAQAGQFLLRQRPDQGLLAGLWEFPSLPMPAHTTPGIPMARRLARTFRIPAKAKWQMVTTVQHAFTHFSQSLHVFAVSLDTPIPLPEGPWQWCSPDRIEALPLSRAQRRIARFASCKVSHARTNHR